MSKLALLGGGPDSLIEYLKSLGVFRVISEQVDEEARMLWDEDDVPVIQFSFDIEREELMRSFMQDYVPTPIVIPWSGSDFFNIPTGEDTKKFKQPPTEGELVKAFLRTESDRLQIYRKSILRSLEAIKELGITKKDITGGGKRNRVCKSRLISLLRSELPDHMVYFIDAAVVPQGERVSPNTLLGSGGGNDGRLHLGGNFMQCLWLCLPEFSPQRDLRGAYKGFDSSAACEESLFGTMSDKITSIPGDSPGLYSPGGVGGPNATEGFESNSLRNPWDFIFNMEGVLLFSGALSRRMGKMSKKSGGDSASFPFMCRLSQDTDLITGSETDDREVWMPIWRKPASLASLKVLFAEGRAEVSGRQARDGIDFARAIVSLGVDRGISEFRRYALVRGRVGGENYHTSTQLGIMRTRSRPLANERLLDDIDPWLRSLRGACHGDRGSAKLKPRLRGLERSIMNFCRNGGNLHLQKVLVELGRSERALAFMGNPPISPLTLSPRWIRACDDGSTEYRIAASLASIYDKWAGPLRSQLEPVSGMRYPKWDKNAKSIGDIQSLSSALSEVLHRRVTLAIANEADFSPTKGQISANLADVHRYLSGAVEDSRIMDLLWGLATVRWWEFDWDEHSLRWERRHHPEIPRLYCLLKMMFLPGNIDLKPNGETVQWMLNYKPEEGIRMPVSLEVVHLLKAGRVSDALDRTVRRLYASGLRPKGSSTRSAPDYIIPGIEPIRVLSSLLIPMWEIDSLARPVLRAPVKENL